ncbi:TPA: hypothetical protein ACXNQL_002276 [Stenotrophomonas maltophilia]
MPKFNKIVAEIAGLYINAMQITDPQKGRLDFNPIEEAIIARALTQCPVEMRPPLLANLHTITMRKRIWNV